MFVAGRRNLRFSEYQKILGENKKQGYGRREKA